MAYKIVYHAITIIITREFIYKSIFKQKRPRNPQHPSQFETAIYYSPLMFYGSIDKGVEIK